MVQFMGNTSVKEMRRIVANGGYIFISIPIFNIPDNSRNKDIIFINSDFVLYKKNVKILFSEDEIIDELVVKEFHTHDIKHEHEYYVLAIKKRCKY